MKHRLRTRFAVVLVALFAPTAAFSGTAAAHPFGVDSGGPGYVADGADHWFCFSSSLPNDGSRSMYYDAMAYLDERTDIYDMDAGSCGSATDVVYIRNDNLMVNGAPVRGFAPCMYYLIYAFCDQAWAGINYAAIANDSAVFAPGDFNNYIINAVKTVRHETGHTVGLSHQSYDDAMTSGWVDNNFWAWWVYSDHNRDHVNGFY